MLDVGCSAMASASGDGVSVDTITLRFAGQDEAGNELHELRAAHVAEVLQGLVGMASDFSKAGAFGDGPSGSEVLVRPAQEGSFLIEVVRYVVDHQQAAADVGVPSLGTVIWWATKSVRAGVKDFTHLDNGMVKVNWQDGTAQEIPKAAWDELQKRKRQRKKQLRQILAPLSDPQVTSVDVQNPPDPSDDVQPAGEPEPVTLRRADYDAARPDDEIEEAQNIFEAEAQMSAIDFDRPAKWRVKTADATRNAVVEDQDFLGRIANGLAIRKSDIFWLRIREDTVVKNGRSKRKWTVLEVHHRRAASHDDDA